MRSTSVLVPVMVLVALASVTAFVAYFRFSAPNEGRTARAKAADSHAVPEVSATPLEVRAPVAFAVVVPVATTMAATGTDEATLLTQMRGVVETDPELALRLAREGNTRYPNGKDGAERGWIICKALTNLRRFDEAREEAKIMVKQYPGTSFAGDITKHILINPGTHPSERGYGKELELE